jgi:DNA helicase-2/ATP-dependent DNA helicase PcrA
MSWNAGLNDWQRRAIESQAQHSAVIAGPGTGKTMTLLHKALQLIEDEVAKPSDIRIVNFTNAGKRDLRKKIVSEAAYSAIDPRSVTTFHALALRVLRAVNAPAIPSPLLMLDDWEEHTLIDRFIRERLGLRDVEQARRMREDYNTRWCIASDDAEDWLSERQRRDYEKAYNVARDLLGFTTLGELTFLWWRYLRSNQGSGHEQVGFPWSHLLVDEYQDLNECEHQILEFLAAAGVCVFVVGDPNQSIYESMRHAHPAFCWQFPKRLPTADLHVLQRSYRCPSTILKWGDALLGGVEGVPDPELASVDGEIHILNFPSHDGEQSGLARLAAYELNRSPKARILFAVPTRKLARGLIEQLSAASVPFDDRTGKAPQGSEECRIAHALLRLFKDNRDGVAAATALVLSCGPSTRAQRVSDIFDVSYRSGQKVAALLIQDIALPAPLNAARERIRRILNDMKGSTKSLEVLAQATGCELVGADFDEVEESLESVLAQSEQLEPGRVTIMTLHGCKGTEAEWVFIPAVEPGFFERDLVGAPKEERRRLLYVGMTRALRGTFLSFAERRFGPGRYQDPRGPSARKGASVFVEEICDRVGYAMEQAQQFLQRRLRS